ncbi:hypothetical protein GJ496_001752 [Pomphorhynchus laevis]|nr:hypothetical protein GJ496_001752 [Pomphorhynchus laevis]
MGSISRKPREVKRIDDYVQFEIGWNCDGCNVWTLMKVNLSTEVTIGNNGIVICPSSTKRQPCRIWTNGRPYQYYRNQLNMQSSSSGTKPIITDSRSPMYVLTKQGCESEFQQSITTESLSGNIDCSFFGTCNNHKLNDTERELDRCGP